MQCIREICPASLAPIKPINNGALSRNILKMLYEHSLPGMLTVRKERMHVIEVGLLTIGIPHGLCKKKRGLSIIRYLKPSEKRTDGIAIDYVLLGATSLGKTYIAFVPIEEFMKTGTHVASVYHKYFTHYPLEISTLARLAEEKRLKKNLEMREMLAKQRGF